MKRLLTASAMVLATLGAAVAPAAAQPYQAFVSTDLNLRSGPWVEYPPVLVLPAGTPVVVQGCIEGWSWCDVTWGEARGWVAGSYLTYEQLGQRVPVVQVAPTIGLPIITFSLGSYWDNHYRARPWYRDRDRWVNHYAARPPGYYGGRGAAPYYGRPPAAYPRARYDDRPNYRYDNRPGFRQDFGPNSRPDYSNRPNDRRPDYRQDRRQDQRYDNRQQRPPERVDNRRNDRPHDGGRQPRGVSGGQTERDANRFNRQRTGPMPGE